VSRYVQTATRGQNREGEDQECGYLLDLNRGDQKHQKSLWTIGLGFTHVGTWNGGFFTSPIFSLSSEAFLPGFSSHSAGEWPVCPQTKHFSCCPVVVTTCHQPQQLTENQMCIIYSKPFNLLVNEWQNKTYTEHSRSHPYQYYTADIKVPLLIWRSGAHVLPEQAWSNLHPAKAHTFLKHQKRVKHQTCKKCSSCLQSQVASDVPLRI
jgi:hypothetical protein